MVLRCQYFHKVGSNISQTLLECYKRYFLVTVFKKICMQQICMLHKMWDYVVAHLKLLLLQFGTI